jgi:glycosyltransferase involved in cell wall biosynthesis
MKRGVDTGLFSPRRRSRLTDKTRIGYVGRLTAEKNVRFLAELQQALTLLGRSNFEFIIVGEGREEEWLRKNMPHAVFTGVLRGERLAELYANLDLFVFPSRTDTFGNVVLEAMASGLPVIVTQDGGPKFLIEPGVTGFVAESDWAFIRAVNALLTDQALLQQMRVAAREYACAQSWDTVFYQVLRTYEGCLREQGAPKRVALKRA